MEIAVVLFIDLEFLMLLVKTTMESKLPTKPNVETSVKRTPSTIKEKLSVIFDLKEWNEASKASKRALLSSPS